MAAEKVADELTARDIGIALMLLREQAGLDQQELAERVGWKRGDQLSRYERGRHEPERKTVARIARELGLRDDVVYWVARELKRIETSAKGRYPSRHLRLVPDRR